MKKSNRVANKIMAAIERIIPKDTALVFDHKIACTTRNGVYAGKYGYLVSFDGNEVSDRGLDNVPICELDVRSLREVKRAVEYELANYWYWGRK